MAVNTPIVGKTYWLAGDLGKKYHNRPVAAVVEELIGNGNVRVVPTIESDAALAPEVNRSDLFSDATQAARAIAQRLILQMASAGVELQKLNTAYSLEMF
jgi:hypothetical protein